MTAQPIVAQAERIVAEAAHALLHIHPRECLLCYVWRMLPVLHCTGLRLARHYRDERAPKAFALEKRLGGRGAFCDCEIFLNGWTLADPFVIPEKWHIDPESGDVVFEDESWPDPLPDCSGVRAGSTQPCELWRVRRR